MSSTTSTQDKQQQRQQQQQQQSIAQPWRPACNLYDRTVEGIVELVVAPNDEKLSEIRLNCRQCHIKSVHVNDKIATFEHVDPLDKLFASASDEKQFGVSRIAQVRYRQSERVFEGNQGELHIRLPSDVSIVKIKNEPMDTTVEEVATVTHKDADTKGEDEYEPLTIRIEYRLSEPQSGLFFVLPDPVAAPSRLPMVYTSNQRYPGVARLWMPCLDRTDECGIWELTFQNEQDDDSMSPVVVACVGEQVEETIDEQMKWKQVRFEMNVPISAPMISFAIGCMETANCNLTSTTSMLSNSATAMNDAIDNATPNMASNANHSVQSEVPVKVYCPIGRLEQTSYTCRFVANMMQFFVKEISSYPFSSCQIVFIDEASATILVGAGLIIASTHILHGKNVIEPAFDSIRVLALALATLWFGAYITPTTNNDIWLVEGLSEYMCASYLKKRLGNNEYRFRLKKDMERVCEMDVDRPAIARFPLNRTLTTDQLAFIRLKAPLVLYMLNKRMLKGGPSLGLNRVIPKMILSAMNGELGLSNAVSTTWFLRTCRKVSNMDLKTFTHDAGCPVFHFKYAFNRKKMVVEITMEQASTADQSALALGEQLNLRDSTVFTGQMTVSVQEADGTLYEHVLDIQERYQKFEVQFNTKYKRIRRTTKRFQARQAAAAAEDANAAAEVAAELQEGEWIAKDDEEAKRAWRIVEWGEEEEDLESVQSGTFEWIRMDSDFEWICSINFYQPGAMCSAQLLKDRDVIAQYEAAVALGTMPSTAASTSLTRAVMDPKCFYRVRMEAALSLAKCAIRETENIGFHHLIKIYEWRYGFSLITLLAGHATMPKPNDSPIFPSNIVAMSHVKDQSGLCLPEAIVFLLHLLRYNDNSENMYSDGDFIATLISSLTCAFTHRIKHAYLINEDRIELMHRLAQDSIKEMERHRSLDAYIPSFHNTVTVACHVKLARFGYSELDPRLLVAYSRYGNFTDIRMAAVSALAILAVDNRHALLNYIIGIAKSDPHPMLRVHAAYSLAEAYAWLLCHYSTDTSDTSNITKTDTNAMEVIETNSNMSSNMDKKKRRRSHIRIADALKRIRSSVAQHDTIREQLWTMIAHSPLMDTRIRRQLELICEMIYEQTMPVVTTTRPSAITKLKIRVPSQTDMEKVKSTTLLSPNPPIITINNTNTLLLLIYLLLLKVKMVINGNTELKSPSISLSIKRKKPVETTSTTGVNNTGTSAKKHITGQRGRPNNNHTHMNAADRKRCMRILSKISSHPAALLFSRPVDPKLDGCPDYYNIIKNPMDLSTIRKKLESNTYTNKDAFAADIRLMINNCFLFNPPGTPVYNQGMQLEDVFDEQWALWTSSASGNRPEDVNLTIEEKPRAPTPSNTSSLSTASVPTSSTSSTTNTGIVHTTFNQSTPTTIKSNKNIEGSPSSISMSAAANNNNNVLKESENGAMTATEQARCKSILNKLMIHRTAGPFLVPVDPVALNIPTYFTVVKSPMDLSTIKRKLDNGEYKTVKAFDADVRLIISNCLLFNPPDSWICNEVKALETYYNGLCKRSTAKRAPKPADTTTNDKAAVSSSPPVVGLTDQEKAFCRKILKSLLDRKEAAPFDQPVSDMIR
ncbi:hypothetical protein BDF22DRAFT_694042 [Syncephalis plumigaleata]|nr:hypothetical protein BDF22DRAFT_694042 [Syncephalis plumigaleata]